MLVSEQKKKKKGTLGVLECKNHITAQKNGSTRFALTVRRRHDKELACLRRDVRKRNSINVGCVGVEVSVGCQFSGGGWGGRGAGGGERYQCCHRKMV